MDDDFFQDKQSEEFDERIIDGAASNQPLTLTVRRIRSREMVVIDWHIENCPKWENPTIFGRRYDNHIPTTMADVSESDNPSRPIVWGSSQRVGSTSEIKLKAGETTYFGFWLKGKTLPKPKGLRRPVWIDWDSHEPITFSVYMPLRADSLDVLKERRDVEYTKGEIRKILRAQEEKPKEEPRKRNPAMEKINKLLEETENIETFLAKLDEAAEKEQSKMKEIDEAVARGEMSKERADALKIEYEQAYSNIRDRIQAYITGEPHV